MTGTMINFKILVFSTGKTVSHYKQQSHGLNFRRFLDSIKSDFSNVETTVSKDTGGEFTVTIGEEYSFNISKPGIQNLASIKGTTVEELVNNPKDICESLFV